MGRYANYHIALMLSLIYGPPMLLCAVYLYFHKKEQNVLTINGSLLGGIKKSQWRHNLLHAPDSEFRLLYKIERRVFRKLCRVIGNSKTFKKYRVDDRTGKIVKRKTRRRKQTYKLYDIIMMVLYFLNSRDSMNLQTQHFKAPQSTLSKYIKYGLFLLEKTLKVHPDSKIVWPTPAEQKTLCKLLAKKFPGLDEYQIWGFVDGVKLPILEPFGEEVQNAYYTSFKRAHVINNVLVFDTQGL